MSRLNRTLGGSPLQFVFKLLLISLLVGLILSALGFTPDNIWPEFVNIFNMVFSDFRGLFGRLADWVILGLMIVGPIFLLLIIARLFRRG